jgi:hypothetical protein
MLNVNASGGDFPVVPAVCQFAKSAGLPQRPPVHSVMLALARRLVLQACIHLLALFSAARTTALNELKDCTSLLATTVSPVGKVRRQGTRGCR